MRLFIAVIIILSACSKKNKTPQEILIGSWMYSTAERLGDGSKNDKSAIAEFDNTMTGRVLTFYKDSMFQATKNVHDDETIIETGQYSLMADGKMLMLEKRFKNKIYLTDSLLKIYSPNNGIFVWRKIKKSTDQ